MSPEDRATFRNVLAFAIPELGWGFAWALTLEPPMLAALSDAFGGSSTVVGLLGTVFFLGMAAPMCLTGWVVEPMARKKPFVLWGHLATAAVWGLVALAIRVAGPSGPTLLWLSYVVGVLAFCASLGFLIPGWLGLFGELFEEGRRGRVLGVIFVFNRAGAALGGEVAHAFLRSGGDPVATWTWLWGLAFAAGFLGSLPFAWIHEPVRPRPRRVSLRAHLSGLVGALRDLPALRRFVAVDALAAVAVVVPFCYGDVGLRHRGFAPSQAGRWVEIGAVAQVVAALVIGWAGPRILPRLALAAGLAAAAGAAVLVAVGATPLAYGVIAAASALFIVSRQTCHAPQVMRLSRGRDGTNPVAIALICVAPVQALGPLVAGWLAEVAGPGPVFLVVAAVIAAACFLLLARVPDASPSVDGLRDGPRDGPRGVGNAPLTVVTPPGDDGNSVTGSA